MHHDGIDRILDFMTDTRRQPADRRHAPRKFQFRLDLLHRFEVVQRDQRTKAHPRMVVVDKVHRSLNATARFSLDLFLHQRHSCIEGLAERSSQHRGIVENLTRLQTQNVIAFEVEKSLSRLRNQHRASVPGEQQNAVLQVSENLVEVFLQGRENLFHIAHALPDLLDLC